MATAYISHKECTLHEMGAGHPEQPARLAAIEQALRTAQLWDQLQHREAPLADRAHLQRAHGAAYVDAVFAAAPERGYVYLDPDTSMNPHSLTAALRAAGGVMHAVDLVMTGKATNAFCAVRPPGHHATRDRAMGFCLFDNVAIGALHVLDAHGLQRVAIVDFDVHHGNGTEDIFHDDERVLLISSFQYPLYPYSGADSGNAHIIPLPLPAGTDGTGFRAAWQTHGLPALRTFAPEMIFFSAGFDAHRDDPLAGLNLVETDFAWITHEVSTIAAQYAQGRMVSTLEGGYDLAALGRSAAAHIQVLLNAAR